MLGTFDESFDMNLGVGDLMLEDEEEKPVDGSGKKKTIGALPEIEGEESVADYLTKFKRACLSKKTQLRDLEDKLKEDQVRGHEPQVCNIKCHAGLYFICLEYTLNKYIYKYICIYIYV